MGIAKANKQYTSGSPLFVDLLMDVSPLHNKCIINSSNPLHFVLPHDLLSVTEIINSRKKGLVKQRRKDKAIDLKASSALEAIL